MNFYRHFIFFLFLLTYVDAKSADLDPSFNTPITSFKNYYVEATDVDIHRDGSGVIVVVGTLMYPTTKQFVILSYNQDGTLNQSFADNGILITNYTDQNNIINAVAIQNDSKIIVAGAIAVNEISTLALVRYWPDGTLDNSFGTDGIVMTDINAYAPSGVGSFAQDIKILNDGKILVVATLVSTSSYLSDSVIVKYNANGTLDTTFASNGVAADNILSSTESVSSMVIENSGDIILGATKVTTPSTTTTWLVRRYDSNGSKVKTFETPNTGITPNYNDKLYNMSIDADGKLVAVGTLNTVIGNKSAIVRFDINGSLDTTFDTDGILTTSLSEEAHEVMFKDNGKIIIAAQANSDAFMMMKFSIDGTLDSYVSTPSVGTLSKALMQLDDKVVMIGNQSNKFVTLVYGSNGTISNYFSGDGIDKQEIESGYDTLSDIALQKDEKIIAVGDGTLARYDTNGSLDTSFADNGKMFFSFKNSGIGKAKAVAIDSDNKIVIAGYSYNTTTSSNEFSLIRFDENGSNLTPSVPDFSTTTQVTAQGSFAQDMAIDENGRIYLVGYSSNGSDNDFAVALYDTSGNELVSASLPIGAGDDEAYGLALESLGYYFVVGKFFNGNDDDIVLARYHDGGLDNSFGNGGMLTYSTGTNDDIAYDVAIDSDGKIIMVGSSATSSHSDFLVLRCESDGSLDTSFATGGILKFSFDNNSSMASHVEILKNGKILVSGYHTNSNNDGFLSVVSEYFCKFIFSFLTLYQILKRNIISANPFSICIYSKRYQ